MEETMQNSSQLALGGLEKTVAPARQLSLTSFPSLTGLRPGASKGILTTETYTTNITLSHLQEAARRYQESPAALLQTAWAKLLGAYTGINDHITFSCILPGNGDADCSHPSSLNFYSFNVQDKGQATCERVTPYFDDPSLNNEYTATKNSQSGEQQNGTLLDLEDLVAYRPGHRLSEDGCNHRQRYAAAVRIQVSSAPAAPLSVTASIQNNLLNGDAAQLMLVQYECILEILSSKSEKSLSEVCMHSAPRLLSVSNPKPTISTAFSPLQSQFEYFAVREPQRIALEFKSHTQSPQSHALWTYAELNQKAEALAVDLQGRFKSLIDHVVPVCMDRCPELYIAVLGVLKAGAAWCPIDPSFPPRRRNDLIIRAGAEVVVVNSYSPQDGIPENVVVVDVAHINQSPLKPSRKAPLAPYSLAYLIWTSGTTGAPKGVPICHQAAVASMKSLQASIPTDVKHGNVRCLQFSQFTFDVFVQDLFYTWGVGGTLISADRTTILGSFSDLAVETEATHAHLTPTFAASVPRKSCPTLEVVTMIGEKLTQDVADDWSEDCRLYNTYGPAETTVVSTLRLVPYKDSVQSANIGLPLPSLSAFVMHDGEVIMRNSVGELALGGLQLSQGYWNDARRTQERFIWSERLQTKLYMTGDLVRQLYDGSFEFVGRTDDLIKIQGIRIELSEIAFTLRSSHPWVRHVEVCYFDRPDRPSNVIVAFLAAPSLNIDDSGTVEDDRAVEIARKALLTARAQLPGYMIPQVFLIVGAIPRTSSAKVDQAAMKQLYADVDLGLWERKLSLTEKDDRVAAHLDSHESMIIDIIADLTGTSMSAMSRQSTLPSIGVDSITATRLVTRLGTGDIAVSIADILGCSTLDDLFRCSRVKHTEATRNVFDISGFNREYHGLLDPDLADSVELVMPVLPLQESLLSESFRHPSSYWSNIFLALDDHICLQRLQHAWEHVAQRTDALRTAFCPSADVVAKSPLDMAFFQLVYKDSRVDWTVLSSLTPDFEARARDRAQVIAEQRQKSHFMDPLWAVTVFLSESRAVMMVSIHHAIRDEPSLDFILADLKSAYIKNDFEHVQQRHQLRDAVSLLYKPDTAGVRRDEEFWASCLSQFTDEDDSKVWPQLKLSDEDSDGNTMTYSWHAERPYGDLRARAANIGAVSLAAILRITWGCVLLEYLEADRIVFGETWSARTEASGLADIVGPLVSVIPVPFQTQGTLHEMLQYHTKFQRQSKAHYGVHPRKLRRMLKKPATGALYPAIFNFVPDAAEKSHGDGVVMWERMDDVVGLTVEHAIALNAFVSRDNTLRLELTTLKQRNDQEHLRILARQIDALLYSALDNPDTQFTQLSNHMPQDLLSLTPSSEVNSINPAWVQSPTEWVDHHASSHPHWPAAEVVSSFNQCNVVSEVWSYEQLHRAYRNVATLLSQHRCTNRMIAVCLDRRLPVYAVVLAIMSTGNTYLPVADDLPEERKSFLLQDSNAAILFTTRHLASGGSSKCKTIFVEDIDFSKPVGEPTRISALATVGAYLLYTSGSTGAPKGVVVSRGNLMSFIEAISHFICSHVDMIALRGKGKWLGMASYAFDVHLLEMFFPWRHGMATITAARYMLLDNLELALRELKVTHASFVPSLVDHTGLNPTNLPCLRYMSLGGEMISKKAIETWSRSHVVLANAYGPTEVTIGCCFRRVGPSTNVRNIGSPLSYTVAHVLRPGTTKYVLRGASGELCLTGDLVATGYHKRSDVKGFVENFNGKRMYRTGDLVRLMADGSLEFLGRNDDQTKIRGQRIELGEVSEAVRSAVSKTLATNFVEVVSLIIQHRALARPQLVAFIAAQKDSQKDPTDESSSVSFMRDETGEDIRAHCRRTLPSFMVPEHLIRLPSLPVISTSRKVNTKHLQAIFDATSFDDLTLSGKPVCPSAGMISEEEGTIRSIAAKVLDVDQARINADSNLFQFGLDSLNVISLTLQLHKLGFGSSVSWILKSPTVRNIALQASQKVEKARTTSLPSWTADLEGRFKAKSRNGVDLANIAAVKPCLPLQETLVASSLDCEGEVVYVNHVILRLSSAVDHQRLHQAWTATAMDHDILRTCFYEFENHFVQVILRESPLSFDFLCANAKDCVPSYFRERESDIASSIIASIGSKPPIKLALAGPTEKGQSGMLLVSLHHALYDAESFSMILDEVYARYQSTSLPEIRTPITAMIDSIERQSQHDMKAYWTRYLKDYKPTLFDLPAAENKSKTKSMHFVTPLSQIERLAISLNGTSASVMQALFGIVLAETLGTDDLVFGAILSGRTVPIENANSILAPCITTIPQRIRIDHSLSIRSIIESAQEGFVESIEYQHTALRAIHRWVKAEGPLFDCLFTYTRKSGKPQWSHLWHEVESSMSSGFPLTLELVADQMNDGLEVRCDYTAAFGTTKRAGFFVKRLENLTQSLVQGKDISLKGSTSKSKEGSTPESQRDQHWTEEERIMKDVVLDMVPVSSENITRDASFFTLGVDSITAISFAKQLTQHGVQCSSADVMRYPCISKLAEHLITTRMRHHASNGPMESLWAPSIAWQDPHNDIPKTYPCTPLQSSMLTQTLGSDSPMYMHHHGIRLLFDDDVPMVKRAWKGIVEATEILRTSFHFSKDTRSWSGAVHKQPLIAWDEWDADMGLEQVLPRIKERFVFREESDFSRPPWTASVIGNVFVLSLHHALYDGESLRMIFYDLYASLKGLRIASRPPFSRAAEAIYHSQREAEDYWARSLDGFKGNIRPPLSGSLHEEKAALKVDITTVLEGCRRLGVTLQSLALLAFAKTLARLTQRSEVVFGHVVGGRVLSRVEADRILGPLFNTVPMRVQLEKMTSTNRDAAQGVQRLTGESQRYQHASLSKVQQTWRKAIGKPDAELFDTLFVFQIRTGAEAEHPWTSVETDDDSAPTEYFTNFECEQTDTEISICVNSRGTEDLGKLLRTFEHLLCEIFQRPNNCAKVESDDFFMLNNDHLGLLDVPEAPNRKAPELADDKLGTVRQLLAEASGLMTEHITNETSIFSLGLDSISAIQLAAAARKEGLKLSVADILQGRTVRGICWRLDQTEKGTTTEDGRVRHAVTESNDEPPHATLPSQISRDVRSKAVALAGLRDDDVQEVTACLPGQYYHLLTWLKSGRTLGEGTWTYASQKTLDVQQLLSAWRYLRERHALLRAVFVSFGQGGVAQVILKPAAIRTDAFQVIDQGNSMLRSIIKQEACRRFDLFTPPAELVLIRGQDTHHVVLKMHHALYDAWTVTRLVQDLAMLYNLESLSTTLDHSSLLQNILQLASIESSHDYWLKSLGGCQQTILRSNRDVAQVTTRDFFFSKATICNLRQLEKQCQRNDTSLPITILIAFAHTLAFFTKTDSPAFGLYQAGRSSAIEGLDEAYIPCLNVTPLMVRDVAKRDTKMNVKELQSDLTARVPFEQSNLRDILTWVGWDQKPLFNTYVNILWGTEAGAGADGSVGLLVPWTDSGDVSDIVPEYRVKGRNAVEGLDTDLLADGNLYLDVQRSPSEDVLHLIARCDYQVTSEDEAEAFMKKLLEEIVGCFDQEDISQHI